MAQHRSSSASAHWIPPAPKAPPAARGMRWKPRGFGNVWQPLAAPCRRTRPVREAALAGSLALAACWGVAELVLALGVV